MRMMLEKKNSKAMNVNLLDQKIKELELEKEKLIEYTASLRIIRDQVMNDEFDLSKGLLIL